MIENKYWASCTRCYNNAAIMKRTGIADAVIFDIWTIVLLANNSFIQEIVSIANFGNNRYSVTRYIVTSDTRYGSPQIVSHSDYLCPIILGLNLHMFSDEAMRLQVIPNEIKLLL